MKYVKQFAVIALMTIIGECMNLLIPLPVPASIYGMLLLFLCLQTGLIKLSQIEETADFFLAAMPIFFISPSVSLMSSIGVIRGSLVGILVITLLSTAVVMVVTGLVTQAVIRHGKRRSVEKMNDIFMNSAYFGIVLSLLAYWAALWIASKVKNTLCNPLLVSTILIIAVLVVLGVDYETFDKGASHLTYLLNPATVCLAVPLYRQFEVLKKNMKAILIGVLAGCLACAAVVLILAAVFSLEGQITVSLLPKSITTAIAIGLSEEIGGISSVTVACVVITGICGACIASTMCKLFKIEEPVAQGLSIGTSAHAIGTSRALELGEIQGAMSSLAIVVTGIMTVVLVPLIVSLLPV